MSSIKYVKKILEVEKKFFTTLEIGQLLKIKSKRTLDNIISRLVAEKVLLMLEKGRYLVESKQASDFEVAQFIYHPSYVSFETALNYHGVLSQFPLEVSSATSKKRTSKEVLGKSYTFLKIKPELFIDYYRVNDFLIAFPEKALFDQCYMISRSFKTEEYLDEMDYSRLKLSRLKEYLKLLPDRTAMRVSKLMEKYL